jgi:hypothetical protein
MQPQDSQDNRMPTDEDKENLVSFFDLLIAVDRRINPQTYG